MTNDENRHAHQTALQLQKQMQDDAAGAMEPSRPRKKKRGVIYTLDMA